LSRAPGYATDRPSVPRFSPEKTTVAESSIHPFAIGANVSPASLSPVPATLSALPSPSQSGQSSQPHALRRIASEAALAPRPASDTSVHDAAIERDARRLHRRSLHIMRTSSHQEKSSRERTIRIPPAAHSLPVTPPLRIRNVPDAAINSPLSSSVPFVPSSLATSSRLPPVSSDEEYFTTGVSYGHPPPAYDSIDFSHS